jgi:hypothetical protein
MEISKEELYKKYIIENCSKKDTAEYFNTNVNTLRHYLDKYKIKKTKEQRLKLAEEGTLKKYGVKNVWSKGSPIRDRIAKTNINRFGAANVFDKNSILRNRIDEVLDDKREETLKKIRETNLKRYGCVSPFGNKEVQEKIKETNKNKYGVDYYLETNNLNITKDDLIETIDTFKKKPTLYELSSKLHIGYSTTSRLIIDNNLRDKINIYDSYLEIKFKELLDKYDIEYVRHNRTLIKPYELDFYLPKYNIAFEVNDFATHLDREEYHEMKRDMCSKVDINLYFIWENQITEENLFKELEEDLLIMLGDDDSEDR